MANKKRQSTDPRTEGPADQRTRTFVAVGRMPKKNSRKPAAVPSGLTNHLAVLDAIPAEAAGRPIDWAGEHLESLVPQAAKEKEWQLKFGSDERRDRVATEILAMKGIAAKRDAAPVVQPAIVLIQSGPNPFAQRVLPASAQTVDVSTSARASASTVDVRTALTHPSGALNVSDVADAVREDETEGSK